MTTMQSILAMAGVLTPSEPIQSHAEPLSDAKAGNPYEPVQVIMPEEEAPTPGWSAVAGDWWPVSRPNWFMV